jgi:hypothetical protein
MGLSEDKMSNRHNELTVRSSISWKTNMKNFPVLCNSADLLSMVHSNLNQFDCVYSMVHVYQY